MTARSWGRRAAWVGACSLAFFVVWSCASPEARLGDVPPPAPSFTSDASTVDAGDDASVAMCVATTCPSGLTTCPSASGPTYACAVDPQSDPKHCGACGNECLSFEPLHMTSRCVEGRCELECLSLPRYVFPSGEAPTSYRNCNGLLDDGCEIDVFSDADNCGACGNACGAGQPCIMGQCGCPDGQKACNGFCVDIKNRDDHCGDCDQQCDELPPGACVDMPPNAYYGCQNGCDKLKCQEHFADCDQDLATKGCASNGCEVDLRVSTEHCGRCGNACAADEECREEKGVIDCRPKCEASGRALCTNGCVDVLNDPDNCGGCDLRCPDAGPRQTRACRKGICENECAPGFGDCNGNPADGCETDLRAHPANCGACGVSCDLSVGQPCVDGRCLVAPCESEEAR